MNKLLPQVAMLRRRKQENSQENEENSSKTKKTPFFRRFFDKIFSISRKRRKLGFFAVLIYPPGYKMAHLNIQKDLLRRVKKNYVAF